MRIFFGPTEVAGYYSSLRRGLEAEGIDVMFADFSTNERKYDDGERSVVVRSVRGIERMASGIPSRHRRLHSIAHRAVSPARVALFLWAALRCDVFVYAYGSTITFHPEWELRLLRRLGRRIIFRSTVRFAAVPRPPVDFGRRGVGVRPLRGTCRPDQGDGPACTTIRGRDHRKSIPAHFHVGPA